MVLTAEQRQETRHDFGKLKDESAEPVTSTKPEQLMMVEMIDSWLALNIQKCFDSLPPALTAKTNATDQQKLFALVAARRAGL